MTDTYKCKFCGKTIKKRWAWLHAIKELPKAIKRLKGGNMGKLIIKDGKLVRVEDVAEEEPVQEVMSEEVKKVIPKAEVLPKPQPAVMEVEETEEVAKEELQPEELVEEEEKLFVTYYFILRSGVKKAFKIPIAEVEIFYNYVTKTMTEKPMLQIENVVIPVIAIDIFYFE